MLPCLPIDNAFNGANAYPECSCDCFRSAFTAPASRKMYSADSSHCLRRQFRQMLVFAYMKRRKDKTPLSHAVADVVFLRTQEQMFRSTTWRVVAAVQYVQAIRNRPVRRNPCYLMSFPKVIIYLTRGRIHGTLYLQWLVRFQLFRFLVAATD